MSHKPNGTQQSRILMVLRAARAGTLDIPEEFILRHPKGDGVSARYFKRVMLISECNGRIAELRKLGYDIESSTKQDPHGFAYQRLVSEPERAPKKALRKPLPKVEYHYDEDRGVMVQVRMT